MKRLTTILFLFLFAFALQGQTVLRSGSTIIRAYDANQPLNIETTCEVWLDGKDASSFTLDGTSVDQWDDKSGNARHVLNGNADATRPTYDINTGRVTFTAADNTFLQSAAFAGGDLLQPITTFVVYKLIGALHTDQVIFAGINSYIWIYSKHSTFRIFGGVSVLDNIATNANDNIHTVLFNRGASKYWINGGNLVSGNPGANTLDGVTLGSRGNNLAASNLDGEICEVIVFNADISDVDRDKITGYLANKWDITATTDFKGYVLYEMMWLILLLIPNIRRKEEEFKIAA